MKKLLIALMACFLVGCGNDNEYGIEEGTYVLVSVDGQDEEMGRLIEVTSKVVIIDDGGVKVTIPKSKITSIEEGKGFPYN